MANAVHHLRQLLRLQAGLVVRPLHIAIQRKMLLNNRRAHRDRRDRHLDALRVVRIANFHPKSIPERLHRPEIHVLVRRRILGVAVKQLDLACPVLAQNPDGVLDLPHLAHARGHDDRLSGFGQRDQIRIIGHLARRNLPERHIDGVQKLDALKVKRRRQKANSLLVAVFFQAYKLVKRQFQLLQHILLGAVPGRGFLVVRLLRRVRDQILRLESLKFDAVDARRFGGVHQLIGQIDVAVVVDAGFRNYVYTHFSTTLHGFP